MSIDRSYSPAFALAGASNSALPAAPASTPDLARLMTLLLTGLLTLSIGWGLAPFFGWLVAGVAGFVLGWAFSRQVHRALGHETGVSKTGRVAAGLLALAIGAVSVGLNSAALYVTVAAESSALDNFARMREETQQQLDLVVEGSAAAAQALSSWAVHSRTMATQETDRGSTCPALRSNNTYGDIARFRDNEAAMAADLAKRMKERSEAVASAYRAAMTETPASFDNMQTMMTRINGSVAAANALRAGAELKAIRDAVQNKKGAQIQRGHGAVEACGDSQRDSLLQQAEAALNGLMNRTNIAPLKVHANIHNRQDMVLLALTRAPRVMGCLLSAGHLCNFAGDPLMQAAFARDASIINRETLPTLLAMLLELLLVIASASRTRGRVPFAIDPAHWLRLQSERHAVDTAASASRRAWRGFALAAAKVMTNASWVLAETPAPRWVPAFGGGRALAPAAVSAEHLRIARLLAGFVGKVGDADVVIVPSDHADAMRAVMAGHALVFEGAAELISDIASWRDVTRYATLARLVGQLSPNAQDARYTVFLLEPALAQAMRVGSLGP